MKFCPRCGSELVPGSNFCHECGYNLSIVQDEPENTAEFEENIDPVVVPPEFVPVEEPEKEPATVKFSVPVTETWKEPVPEPVIRQAEEEPAFVPPPKAAPAYVPPPPPPPAREPRQEIRTEPIPARNKSPYLHLVQRVVNMLIRPKSEWLVIESEESNKVKLLTGYILILALLPFILDFISFAFIRSGYSLTYAITNSILSLAISISVVYLSAYISEYLAPSFFAPKDFGRSFQLICYSFTPVWVSSILTLFTGYNLISIFLGFAYMTYLLRTGIPVLKKADDDKALGYSILMVISAYFTYMVVIKLLEAIIL